MKFICKDFWTALFGRQAGGLKTNHKVSANANLLKLQLMPSPSHKRRTNDPGLVLQGRFVIDDPNLRWLAPLRSSLGEPFKMTGASDSQEGLTRQRVADLYITLAAGCLKGALFHLNCTCNVAGSTSKSPACANTLPMLPPLLDAVAIDSKNNRSEHIACS
jgi:hypothetical protein